MFRTVQFVAICCNIDKAHLFSTESSSSFIQFAQSLRQPYPTATDEKEKIRMSRAKHPLT